VEAAPHSGLTRITGPTLIELVPSMTPEEFHRLDTEPWPEPDGVRSVLGGMDEPPPAEEEEPAPQPQPQPPQPKHKRPPKPPDPEIEAAGAEMAERFRRAAGRK
jgi:hypothetical protein